VETIAVILRVALSLGAVFALIWYVQRRVNRGRRTRPTAAISMVTRQSLGSKSSVVVVEVDGQRLLLGVTEQSVTVLQTAPVPEPTPAGETFASALAAVDERPLAVVLPGPGAVTSTTPPLHGSILSLSTWKQAAQTLRRSL
jgi:flagellar protein FliO/FliZ